MLVFAIKNPENYQTNDTIQTKDTRQKKPTSCTISKTVFSPEGCLLFLSKDI